MYQTACNLQPESPHFIAVVGLGLTAASMQTILQVSVSGSRRARTLRCWPR